MSSSESEQGEIMSSEGFRDEQDSMGSMQIPADRLYGAQTERARQNFPISRLRFSRKFIRALGTVKRAAAETNADLGLLEHEIASAIRDAAEEMLD